MKALGRLVDSRLPYLLVLLIVAVVAINSRKPSRDRFPRWRAEYTAEQMFAVSEAGLFYKPGGMPVTEPDEVERLLARPAVRPPMAAVTSEALGLDIIFPHVADGTYRAGNIRIETSIVMIGTGNRDSEATLRFYGTDGSPLELSVMGTKASEFRYTVGVLRTIRIQTDGTGPLQVGWAKLHVSQPVSAALTFSIYDLKGHPDAEVGVEKASPEKEFAIFAEYDGLSNTGVAIVNTDPQASNRIEFILNDPAGNPARTEFRTLGPNEKVSLFITELFPELAGQTSFRGLLILRAERPIAALTLRQRGRHLTSLPVVRRYAAGEAPGDLFFYRLGSGVLGSLMFQTSFILINHSEAPANAVLDLWREDGQPLVIKTAEGEDSTLNLTVPPFGCLDLSTSDQGPIQLGWGRLRSDQPLGATAIFTLSEPGASSAASLSAFLPRQSSRFVSEVGVEGTIPLDGQYVFADTISYRNTAIALTNISETASRQISLSLWSRDRTWVGSTSATLGPRQHTAKFLTDLFPSMPNVDEFEGFISVGGDDTVAGTLRLAGTLMTSFPVFINLHGFAPTASVEFHNLLGGTRPSATFKIQQFDQDMSLQRVEVNLPGVTFHPDVFADSESAVIVGDSGFKDSTVAYVQGWVDSVDPDGTVDVSMLGLMLERQGMVFSTRWAELATLILSPSADPPGITAVIEFLNSQPNTYIGDDLYFQLFFPAGFVELPAPGSVIQAGMQIQSVSQSRRADRRLAVQLTQDIALPEYSPAAPRILGIVPFRGRTQAPLGLFAANLAPNSNDIQVLFSGPNGTSVPGEVVTRDGDILLVDVPDGSVTGPVRLKQGEIESNTHEYLVAFGPVTDFSLEAVADRSGANLQASLSQRAGEYQYQDWRLNLGRCELALDGLAKDQVVGSGNWSYTYWSKQYELRVNEVGADYVILWLIQKGYSTPDMILNFSQLENGVLIRNVPRSDPLTPVFVVEFFGFEWRTTTPLLRLPQPTQTVEGELSVSSCRITQSEITRYWHHVSHPFEIN